MRIINVNCECSFLCPIPIKGKLMFTLIVVYGNATVLHVCRLVRYMQSLMFFLVSNSHKKILEVSILELTDFLTKVYIALYCLYSSHLPTSVKLTDIIPSLPINKVGDIIPTFFIHKILKDSLIPC